jgi:hypothetical protein
MQLILYAGRVKQVSTMHDSSMYVHIKVCSSLSPTIIRKLVYAADMICGQGKASKHNDGRTTVVCMISSAHVLTDASCGLPSMLICTAGSILIG